GGGTDATGRLIAPLLRKYLPGEPGIVIQNHPGANGIVALNAFIRRTQPDGLTLMMSSNSSIDPMIYRNSAALYDPKALPIVGGAAPCSSSPRTPSRCCTTNPQPRW